MKLLNKIMIMTVGVGIAVASCLVGNDLVRTHADDDEIASIVFDGTSNSYIGRAGNGYEAITSNKNVVEYSVIISDNLTVETNGYSIKLTCNDANTNYFIMQFGKLKGIKEVSTYSTVKTVVKASAYRYKTADVIENKDKEPTKEFNYAFETGDNVSDLWKLSLTLTCPANGTVTFYTTQIMYSVNDCMALNY